MVKVGTRCNSGYREASFLKHFRQGTALCLALLLSFALSGTSHAQQRGVKQTQHIEESVTGRYLALLIGNNDYQHWPKLKTAVFDVEMLRDVLLRRYGFRDQDVILLRDATRRGILGGFNRLRKQSSSEDSVLVYYAGHGVYSDNQDGYWIPVDGEQDNDVDYIGNDDVLNRMRAIDARHKLVISDSCFSGKLLTRGVAPTRSEELQTPGYYLQKNRLISAQGLTSGGNEPVYDGGPRWRGNSVFAYHLLAQLEANYQRHLSISELGLAIAKNVANDTQTLRGASQTPQVKTLKNQGDQGGEFFFVRPQRRRLAVLSLFVPPTRGVLAGSSAAARRVIEQKLLSYARGIPDLRWQSEQAAGSGPDAGTLGRRMRKEELDVVLVWTFNGKVEPRVSSLWAGMALLDLRLLLFREQEGKAVLADEFTLSGELLPVRKLKLTPEEVRTHFGKVAQKITMRWEESGVAGFLRGIIE